MCSCCRALQIEIDGEGYVVTSLVLRYKVSKRRRPASKACTAYVAELSIGVQAACRLGSRLCWVQAKCKPMQTLSYARQRPGCCGRCAAIGLLTDGHVLLLLLLVRVCLQLHKGKYVRDHSRLEVQPTGRYFLNMMLGECSTPAALA